MFIGQLYACNLRVNQSLLILWPTDQASNASVRCRYRCRLQGRRDVQSPRNPTCSSEASPLLRFEAGGQLTSGAIDLVRCCGQTEVRAAPMTLQPLSPELPTAIVTVVVAARPDSLCSLRPTTSPFLRSSACRWLSSILFLGSMDESSGYPNNGYPFA